MFSPETHYLAGVALLTIVTIEFGGWFLSRVVRGAVPMTDFQKSFARAGHAHAGVLVILGLVCLLYTDATDLTGAWVWIARVGVLAAAVLMSAGFFLSSIGRDVTRPNRLIALLWLGALSLGAGVLTLGVGLLTSA
ncbi:hypothetical protein SAMN05216266_107288 [Amycolatopsis marina]|uniref:Integral membrane protein n=1 Tax=Amycolatopsis marina TaxID=490629 RepID=A0A1I0ZUX5_9PSEU|nr:hypothetical protein [Amycolatopsis marina]SFB29092.1 hypothetical protein SAMN05216266_107288 [Amycolatopsis marina]